MPKNSDSRDVATGDPSVYMCRHAHDGHFLLATHPSLPQRKRAGRKKYETGGCAADYPAEAVWVLTSFYNLERQKVAESLAKLLIKAGVQVENGCPLSYRTATMELTPLDPRPTLQLDWKT